MSTQLDARPVGVFDSGLGGLSVVREIRRLLPAEQLIYVSDARYLPYGDREEAFIRERAHVIAAALLARDIKALVIACNTATAAAADLLRSAFDIPIVGIEPAVKPAAAATRSGVIGILATAGTLASRRYAELVERHQQFARVINQPCPGLVECIEAQAADTTHLRALLRGYIQPLLDQGADTLVLGCTHYPLVIDLIRDIAGAEVRVIEPGLAVARRLAEVISPAPVGKGGLRCLTSADPTLQSELIARILGESVQVSAL